jgi:hypothetical protein
MTDPYTFHYDMPSQRVSDSEIVVQKQCLDMIAKLFPHTRVAAVPNGQKRTRWQQQQAKREGMSKGFPDLILTGSKFPTSDRSDLFPDWLMFMMECGHNCGVFRSDRTLEAKMREWGFR